MYDIATALKKHINRILAEEGKPDRLISKPVIQKAVEATYDEITFFIVRRWLYRLTDDQLKNMVGLESSDSIKAALISMIEKDKHHDSSSTTTKD